MCASEVRSSLQVTQPKRLRCSGLRAAGNQSGEDRAHRALNAVASGGRLFSAPSPKVYAKRPQGCVVA